MWQWMHVVCTETVLIWISIEVSCTIGAIDYASLWPELRIKHTVFSLGVSLFVCVSFCNFVFQSLWQTILSADTCNTSAMWQCLKANSFDLGFDFQLQCDLFTLTLVTSIWKSSENQPVHSGLLFDWTIVSMPQVSQQNVWNTKSRLLLSPHANYTIKFSVYSAKF